MSKNVKTMSHEEKLELVKKIGDVLVANDLADVKIELIREQVCALGANELELNQSIRVAKSLPSTGAEKAKKFNEEIKPVIEGIEGVSISVNSQFGCGDMYDTITDVAPLDKDEKVSIEHKEGQVLLVDFWATWCPPCQAPMAHNQSMLEKRAADWGDKVRIIGVSIDQSKEKLVSHVNDKKWTSVEHYHRHQSKCSETYGVKGVPNVMLVDKSGRIVFKGHPANRKDLEKDFDDLLKGEKLTGPNTYQEGAAADAKPEDENEEGFGDVDSATIHKEIDSLQPINEEFQKNDDLKASAQKLQRAFNVLVFIEKYNPKTQATKGNYMNYRVLVGPKADVEKVKAAIEEKFKGSYKVQEQIFPQ